MQAFLAILLYIAIAVLVVVLLAGLWNMTRSSDNQASTSNKLMRARVAVQFVVILILIALGIAYGAINIGF